MRRTSLLSRLERSEIPTRAPSAGTDELTTDVIDELRRRMSEVMGTAAAPHSVPKATFDDLPLIRREHSSGPLWHRLVRVPMEYRVGYRGCYEAFSSNWTQVALLSLSPHVVDTQLEGVLFLDTETTGFGGAGTLAFLVGLAYVEAGRLVVEQLMLEGPEQEQTLLDYLRGLVRERPLVISFNGKSFDWPLLLGRYTMNRMVAPTGVKHLDLLHLARRVHKQRLRKCTLQSLEKAVLGFERLGDIDGAEVAARYAHYCRTQDASHLGPVIEHNYWDVLSMVALVGVYGADTLALAPMDLAGAAATLARAKALPQALLVADRAVAAGQTPEDWERTSLVRAEIRKALGDKSGAVADYETAVSDPRARLELAKLYEHHLKDPERAWALVQRGTSERPEAAAKRGARLARKRTQ